MSPALPLSMRRQLLVQPRPRTGPFKSPSPRPGSFRRSLMPPLPPPGPFPSPSHPRSFPPPSAALGAPAVWHQSIGPRVQQYRAVPTERGACLSHHPHPPRAPPSTGQTGQGLGGRWLPGEELGLGEGSCSARWPVARDWVLLPGSQSGGGKEARSESRECPSPVPQTSLSPRCLISVMGRSSDRTAFVDQ